MLGVGVYPNPVDVTLIQLPKNVPYCGIFRGGVAVIRQDMLSILKMHLPPHSLGRCAWSDGRNIDSYSTIYFKDFIQVRGGADTEYFICWVCGFIGRSTETEYVLRNRLPEAAVYQDRGRSLYLRSDLARTFPWKQFREFRPIVIPIRDEPLLDDPLPKVQEANHRLMEAFAGDWQAAKDAIEAEARRLAKSGRGEIVRMTVRSVPLLVKCWVTRIAVRAYVMSLQ